MFLFWVVGWGSSVGYRRFGTAYVPHLLGFLDPCKMGPMRRPCTSVTNQTTLRNKPEEQEFQLDRGKSLKSRNGIVIWVFLYNKINQMHQFPKCTPA
jgi:hypothetical protein